MAVESQSNRIAVTTALPGVVQSCAHSWRRRSCSGRGRRRAVCQRQGDRTVDADATGRGWTGPRRCTTHRPSSDVSTPGETLPANRRTVPSAMRAVPSIRVQQGLSSKQHFIIIIIIIPYLTLPYHTGKTFYRLARRPPAGPMRIHHHHHHKYKFLVRLSPRTSMLNCNHRCVVK